MTVIRVLFNMCSVFSEIICCANEERGKEDIKGGMTYKQAEIINMRSLRLNVSKSVSKSVSKRKCRRG